MNKLIITIVTIFFLTIPASSQTLGNGGGAADSKPTLESNVKRVLTILGMRGSIEIRLIRKAVLVATPVLKTDGTYDHSLLDSIKRDQERAKLDPAHKAHWKKSPKFFSWIFRDGSNAYREIVREASLEADYYYPTDKNLPDYIKKLITADKQREQEFGIPAPPYYWKMDVDYGYSWKEAFIALKHAVLRQTTCPKKIAALISGREKNALDSSEVITSTTGNK